MELNGILLNDIRNKLVGSTVLLNGNPVTISDRGYTDKYITLLYTDIKTGKGSSENFTSGQHDNLQFFMPDNCMINVGISCGYIYRLPQRQWRVGYHSGTYSYYSHFNWELRRGGIYQPGEASIVNSTNNIKQVYFPEFNIYQEVIDSIYSGEILGSKISRDFAIHYSSLFKFPVVQYKTYIIGWVNSKYQFHVIKDAEYLEQVFPFKVFKYEK